MPTAKLTMGHTKPVGFHASSGSALHPLDPLSVEETNLARQIVLNARGSSVALIRSIALEEPPKKELSRFLELEHAGRVTSQTPRPSRRAKLQYDVIRGDKNHEYMESWVDLGQKKEVDQRTVDKIYHAALTTYGVSNSLYSASLQNISLFILDPF
jgi:primary-amine oxidase